MNHAAHEKLKEISLILLKEVPDLKSAGLLNGKMGISLYFYHLAEETGTQEYHEIAGQLIDEVYEDVNSSRLPPDFATGLAGIAWGIEHLARHGFVDAETDLVLQDVDDKIYQYLTNNTDLPAGVRQGILGYMLYILARLEGKDLNAANDATLIFQHLLSELINRLCVAIEEGKPEFREPFLFDITWELPLSLVILSRCHAIQIHRFKIERILNDLTPVVLSFYPRLSSHRLFLLYGMECILQQIALPGWKQHSGLLKENIQMTAILDDELKNKHIRFFNGITGIDFISRRYARLAEDPSFLLPKEKLIQKITTSEYWEWIEQHETERKDLSLFTGLAGVGMGLLECLKEQPVEAGPV